jgi:hypothetical protein
MLMQVKQKHESWARVIIIIIIIVFPDGEEGRLALPFIIHS